MKKNFKSLYAAAVGVLALVATSPVAHASLSLPSPGNTSLNGTNTSVSNILGSVGQSVINIIFLIAGILAVVYLLWSGVQYISAGGNADRVKTARQGIINAVIGIVVILSAYFIIRLTVGLTGSVTTNGNGNFSQAQSIVRTV